MFFIIDIESSWFTLDEMLAIVEAAHGFDENGTPNVKVVKLLHQFDFKAWLEGIKPPPGITKYRAFECAVDVRRALCLSIKYML